MKNKKLLLLMLSVILVLTVCVLAACNPNEDGVKYTVTFSLGEYTEGTAPEAQQVAAGQSIILPRPEARDKYDFGGWSDGTNIFQAGDNYTVNGDVTLTAVWTPKGTYYTVTFDLGEYKGGTAPAPKTVKGVTQIELPDPGEWQDHTFDGWYLGGAEQTKYAVGAKYMVNASVTFYASWRDNGRILQEYRGMWVDPDTDVWLASNMFDETFAITADSIWHCGCEATSIKDIEDGGYECVFTYWDSIVNGELTFICKLIYKDNQLCCYYGGAVANPEYDEDSVVILERDEFDIFFEKYEEDPSLAVLYIQDDFTLSDEDLSRVPTASDMGAGFVGWYTADGGNFYPDEPFDPTQKFYTSYTYYAKYDYYGTYHDEQDNSLVIDGKWVQWTENGSASREYTLDYNQKTLYTYNDEGYRRVFNIDWENHTFEDVTPPLIEDSAFEGDWYGLYYDGLYYEFDLTDDGRYQVATWQPGRAAVNDYTYKFYSIVDDMFELTIGDDVTLRGKFQEDGTLDVTIKRNHYTMVKVGTIEGSWTGETNTLVFDGTNVTCGEISAPYTEGYEKWTATLDGEELTFVIAEYGEMNVTSTSEQSKYAGYYIPGTTTYTHPASAIDKLVGQFHGFFDDNWVYRFDFDGLGRVKPYSWDINPERPQGPDKYDKSSYTIDADNNVKFTTVGRTFTGTLSEDGKMLTVTTGSKTYVLVTVDAVVGTHTIDDQQYVFTEDTVTIDGDSVTYTFETLPYSGELEYASWKAEHNNIEYHFYFTEEGFAVSTFDLEKDDRGYFPSKLKGSWEGATDDEGCSYVFTFNSDKTGYVEYDDGSEKGSYEIIVRVSKAGIISFFKKADDSKIGTVTINSGDPTTINVVFYDHEYNNLTPVAPKVVPAKDLYPGTWTVNDGEGDYTIVIKSDGTGSLKYDGDYMQGGEDIALTPINWQYDSTSGKITFTANKTSYTMSIEGENCYLSVGSYKIEEPMKKTAEEVSDIKQESYYGEWTVSDGDGDYTIEIKEGGTGSIEYDDRYGDLGDAFGPVNISWTFNTRTGALTFTCYSVNYQMLFKGEECFLTVGEAEIKTAMTKVGGDTPPAKEHDDAWYHNVLKGSWNTIEYSDGWDYYFEFDGAGKVTLSRTDGVDDDVIGTATYTINDDGTITFKVLTYSFTITVVDETHIDVVMDRKTYTGVEKKAAAVDYQALLKAHSWKYVDDEEMPPVTYTFTFDGNGSVTIETSDMDEGTGTYSVDAEGKITLNVSLEGSSFTNVTGTITADGKLTLHFWGEDHEMTK